MEPGKLNNDNFQNFIKLQKDILESYMVGANVNKSVLELDELFRFFDEHFGEFHQKENFVLILAFVHRCLKVWIRRGDYLKDDIGILLVNLITGHRENESEINIVGQIIYQVMYSIKYIGCNDVLISEKLLHEVIVTMPMIESRTLASSFIACIQLYVEIFPQNRKNLEPIWTYVKYHLQSNFNNGLINDIVVDILMQLIDDFKSFQSNFHDEPILISTIQHLLRSVKRKFRKCGYYLVKKLLEYLMESINTTASMWMSSDTIQHIERSWILYITISENLEEEQSHLILPSLGNLNELVTDNHLPSSWLDILYIRLLTHNNNLVRRWSIEFCMKTFSCSDLSGEILKHLLQATNSNLLFNYEGYFLKKDCFASFLKGDIKCLLTLFSDIENWKSVPLYIWLESFLEKQLPLSLKFEDILKVSSCIRKLQNCVIREKAITVCQKLFEDNKQNMTMNEYVIYIETLYNFSDKYTDHAAFFSKKSSLISSTPESSIFKQRFYEIFTNAVWDNNELISFLNDVPVEHHGWLKFAPFKLKINESDRKCINNLYGLDLDSIATGYIDIDIILNTFSNSLLGSPPHDKCEQIECNQAAISFYIYQAVFKIENSVTLRFILNTGINNTEVLVTYAQKLLDTISYNLWFIDELLKYNTNRIHERIARHLYKYYEKDVVTEYCVALWRKGTIIFDICGNNAVKQIIEEWISGLVSHGNKRIEEAFCFNHLKFENVILISSLLERNYETFPMDLLKYNIDISMKKPRYFENSNEHRAKLRIASFLYYSIYRQKKIDIIILDQIWNIILNENNQLNVVYIYEYILGTKEIREDVILFKLKQVLNLTPSNQLSIMSVAYIYFQKNNTKREMKNAMVSSLLSLTMGANFQIRLFAQMSLYGLLKNNFTQIEEWKPLIQSIEAAIGTKLPEYYNDIRLHFTSLSSETDIIRMIFYVTNVPFDELYYLYTRCPPSEEDILSFDKFKPCRERYLNKFIVAKNENIMPNDTINHQLQRKLNPVNDLTEPHNLIVYPIEDKSAEMFVVASLIDKLPNLGGIARTCEVLGIKNLVIDSKMHLEQNPFKNLSMTAERTLNILEVKPKDLKEFLIEKKLKGYNIVGAEQTCYSQNFINFQFPKKCILLLGHEKDGIPAPLLGLLNAAVEIPQFGQVRSLNVHVTGALFIWEYCKQHLIQK